MLVCVAVDQAVCETVNKAIGSTFGQSIGVVIDNHVGVAFGKDICRAVTATGSTQRIILLESANMLCA